MFSFISRLILGGAGANWLLTTPPELMAYQVQNVIYDAQHLTTIIQTRVPDLTVAFTPVFAQLANLFV